MILSVSRRTDIPAFYSDWFFKQLDQGFVLVPNPIALDYYLLLISQFQVVYERIRPTSEYSRFSVFFIAIFIVKNFSSQILDISSQKNQL